MTDGADLPGLAEVVPLLHRADWTRLSFSGEVSGNDRAPAVFHAVTMRRGDQGRGHQLCELRVAPGGRYRLDSAPYTVGTGPPFPALLCPSWLLTGYELSVAGRVTACGRPGIRVTGTARPRLDSSHERVDVVIDAELGILLRCERVDCAADLLEFVTLDVPAQADDPVFAPPPGSRVPDGAAPLASPALLASPAGPPAVGLATRALGAAVKFTPFGKARLRPDHEAGEQIPDDDPPPDLDAAGAAGADDEILLLLYRSGASVPRFTATLHTWAAHGDMTTHQVSTARIDGWYRYRVERTRAGQDGPALIACNRRRYWEVREDRVSIDEPRPAPARLADLADASWLLGCEVSGGEAITVDGRPAYRVSVRGGQSRSGLPDLDRPAVAVVDAESGRLLRLTAYADGKPAFRHELRDVAEAAPEDGWDFDFEAPSGLRVVRAGADDDRPLSGFSPARTGFPRPRKRATGAARGNGTGRA